MTQKAKTYMLPVAMATGSLAGYLLPDLTARWATLLAPILIFAMLLVTYCKISPNDLHIKPLHGWLLAVQIIGGLTIFGALYFWDPIIAEELSSAFSVPQRQPLPSLPECSEEMSRH